MTFISSTWFIWLAMVLLGWGAAVYLKQNSARYLTETEEFGENVTVYFGLIGKIWVGIIVGSVGAVLLAIALLS